jgi:hypothetical protein
MYLMTKNDLLVLIATGVSVKTELKEGNLNLSRAQILTKGILEMNYAVDQMVSDKNDHYYNLVECCHNYYRLLDEFIH